MKKINLLFFTIILLYHSPIFPQETKVTNVNFELKNNNVFIYYDLEGDKDAEYNVSVTLRREEISGYIFVPTNLSGDVGEGKFVGKGRTIIWEVHKDFHIDEEVTDYYFEVKAEKAGGSSWYYYVGGAVIAGGVAALLLVGGEENGEVTQTAIKPPPIRP